MEKVDDGVAAGGGAAAEWRRDGGNSALRHALGPGDVRNLTAPEQQRIEKPL